MSSYLEDKQDRISQFARYLRLMGLRTHKVAKADCFIIFDESPPDDADTRQLKASVAITADCLANGETASGTGELADGKPSGGSNESSRYIQLAFKRDCFYLELPNNTLYLNEAEQIFRQRQGFFWARNRTDLSWVRANWKDIVQWDPLQKVYLYRDEESAAQDMAFIAYQVWNFPIDWRWYIKAAAFTQATDLNAASDWIEHLTMEFFMAANRTRSKPGGGVQKPKSAARRVQPAADAVRAGSLFDGLRLGKAMHHNNLTLFPLSWSKPHEPAYLLLGTAIESGHAVVEEISESGSVPNLVVTNKADRPLLIPEGEILIGAKQNRVVNITVLVAAGVKFMVPVSCVEAGRWRYQSRHFESKFCAPHSLRSKKMQAVHKNRADHGIAASNQGEVWDQVQACLASVNATSGTASLTDGFVAAQERLEEYRQVLPLPPEAAGMLVARGDHVVGMDLFDSLATLQSLWNRLRDAYFFDALGDRPKRRQTSRKAAQAFLDDVAAARQPRPAAIGLGDELEIAGDHIVGAALLYAGQLCHLSAFAISC